MKRKSLRKEDSTKVYERIREILQSAKVAVSRSVNTTQVVANWLIGREIVEEEPRGQHRAGYGQRLLHELSKRLTTDAGRGWSVRNLEHCCSFYRSFPLLLGRNKTNALRSFFTIGGGSQISNAARSESELSLETRASKSADEESEPTSSLHRAARDESLLTSGSSEILRVESSRDWQPGQLHPNLSWTHYRTLLRVDNADARAFYQIEAVENRWSARELERQINSLLYERLALSKDKKGLLRLATKGQEIQQPTDIFKDPVVMEFLGLPESPRLVETDLEQKLIDNLQTFLLELGKGFAFVKRQERLTLEGDHFYVDLVFYHTILKCYVLIDLNTGKLTHEDLGQLQLYVNYYDRERRTEGDQPTLGLILCTDKNDTVVKYTLGPDQQNKIFASRYKLHLPTEKELQDELRREVRFLTAGESKRPRRTTKR